MRTVDLCAGIGGISLAFEQVGFRNVFAVENNKFACKTFEANFGYNPMGDIESVKHIPEYDVLLSGFPCQSFSEAGLREGFKDEARGTIFFHIADIIDKTRPRAFMLENVRGLLRHDKCRTFGTIMNILSGELDYRVHHTVLNACDFGLPQNRPRVFIVGFSDHATGDKFQFPHPLDVPKPKLKSIIEKEPVSKKYYISQRYWDSLRARTERHRKKGHGHGLELLDPEGIANTLLSTGGSGKEKNVLIDNRVCKDDYDKNSDYARFLTPREWSRLQGFDDSFNIPVSDKQAYIQFGNSVAIPVVRSVAREMWKVLR